MSGHSSRGSGRLDSWKAIAACLGRDERTVQRWERKLALPVRRLPGGRGASVFAYAADLDAWLTGNEPAVRAPHDAAPADPAPDTRPPRRWAHVASVAAMLAGLGRVMTWERQAGWATITIHADDIGVGLRRATQSP